MRAVIAEVITIAAMTATRIGRDALRSIGGYCATAARP
jgi:hypothetical protein